MVTLLLAIQPVTSLISADAGRTYSLVLVFSAAQLAILAVWWMWSTRPVLVWVLIPAYYLLAAGVWLVYAAHGRATAGTGVVLHGLAAELLVLPLVLVFPILSFSTDWVNRVQAITRQALLLRDPQRGPAPVFPAAAVRHRDHRGGAAGRGDPGRRRPGGWPGRRPGHGRDHDRADPAGWHRLALAAEVSRPWIFAGAAVFVIVFLLLVDLTRSRLPAGASVRHRRDARPGPAGAGRTRCSPSCSS